MEFLKDALKLWISLPSSAKTPSKSAFPIPQKIQIQLQNQQLELVTPLCSTQFASQRDGFADGSD